MPIPIEGSDFMMQLTEEEIRERDERKRERERREVESDIVIDRPIINFDLNGEKVRVQTCDLAKSLRAIGMKEENA